MWQEVKRTPGDHLLEALDTFRKADRVTRECVEALLLGCDTPESYDRLERAAARCGKGSYEDMRLDAVGRNVDAIVRGLRHAGVSLATIASPIE